MTAMLIGRERRNAFSGKVIDVFDPATGTQIAQVPDGDAEDVNLAVEKAQDAFERGLWTGLTASKRAQILWRMGDLIDRDAEALAREETLNNGMPTSLALYTIKLAAEQFRYYAGWCTKIHGQATDVAVDGTISGALAEFHAYTRREPVGVAGLITPWNVPISMACSKLAPALAAGCAVVIKPAEETPLTTLRLCEMLLEAGVPEGVVNVVTGYGHTAGAALAAHDQVMKIAFTGSTEVGKLIVQAASGNLKKVSLELGGKSPIIIFDDADLAEAIPGAATGIFVNSGQACIVGSRLFVHEKHFDAVVVGITDIARSMKLGSGLDADTHLGPLISQKQLDRVMGYVEEGVKDGGKIVTGGRRVGTTGYFAEPTVITNVDPKMRLVRDEIFGPVLAVMRFKDTDDVIRIANNSSYGLAAGMWTRDVKRAHNVAKRLQAGSVWINCQLMTDRSMPFGGYKQSGWGRENGWEGLESFLQTKSVFTAL